MPTIIDVAKQAGVSPTTVSRVLNNNPHAVGSETRERVLKVVKELNFMPNPLAKGLLGVETHLIGVIVGDASDPYYANIVKGISDTAQSEGYLTIVCNTDRDPDIELRFLSAVLHYSADGIVFASGGSILPEHQDQLQEIVNTLNKRHVPVVALGNRNLNVPQISIDDVQAAQDMTEYLIELGHQSIGFILGPSAMITSQRRLEGYQRALEKFHIPYNPRLVIEGDFTFESGLQAANHFMDMQPLVSAVFTSNDREALGCLFGLKQKGILVPEQVSIAGFDDIEMLEYVSPTVTTVRVPMYEIGAMGIKQILKAIKTKEVNGENITLPHKLVIRESTIPLARH
jgi:DNA-binding LacI/PurR family transcriptional regulator